MTVHPLKARDTECSRTSPLSFATAALKMHVGCGCVTLTIENLKYVLASIRHKFEAMPHMLKPKIKSTSIRVQNTTVVLSVQFGKWKTSSKSSETKFRS